MPNETDKNDKYFAEDHIYTGNKKEPFIRAWGNIVLGLILALGGFVQFFKIQKWEINGGTIEMTDIEQLLYKLGGKWTTLGIVLALALFFIARGYLRYKRLKAM